ncbi:hypothetical protein NMYAN_40021 [Nitrosomonas nitrosa]|uniref:Uncharacterized protein n=1 Tax=Nitrosomonas nitrosa TaxID=52442 RepID=A0A8H8Z210_9PROT|nr:hypothetical protein NMYAN_40021 [Nitrosomonas nitrosa]
MAQQPLEEITMVEMSQLKVKREGVNRFQYLSHKMLVQMYNFRVYERG